MSIVYDPTKLLKKIAPRKKIERLVNKDLTLNKAVLSLFDDVDFIVKRDVKASALKVIKEYRRKFNEEREAGAGVRRAFETAVNEKKLLVNRVQNVIIQQIALDIRDEYEGEKYRWLPSTAENPDPEHQLKYGEIFTVGVGEMPGDRYGCQCGMEILTKGDKLEL